MATMLSALLVEIQKEFPTFRIVKKQDSFFMRVLHRLLFVVTIGKMTSFLQQYTTTLGTTVYVPTSWELFSDVTKVVILRHERVHMRQASRFSFLLFAFLYIFMWLPLGLSWWRAKFEMEAYAETIQADCDLGVDVKGPKYKKWMISQFTGPSYGWMWPFRKTIEQWFDTTLTRALQNDITARAQRGS